MFKYGNIELRACLLNIFNDILKSGCFDESWRATLFTMLPKMGDTSRPSCWRPIAILKMSYKIFSKLICQRLRATLDSHQSIDQTGFRPGAGIEGAKTILRIIMETLSESKFSIQRGVKQGDVISPILFNAVLEPAMRKWKRKLLASHGLVIAGKKLATSGMQMI